MDQRTSACAHMCKRSCPLFPNSGHPWPRLMTAGFLQLLQIDGSALPANDGQYHPVERSGHRRNLIAGWVHRGIFSTSGWGSCRGYCWSGRERFRSLPQQVWRTPRVLRLVPTVTVHEVRTLSPQIAPGDASAPDEHVAIREASMVQDLSQAQGQHSPSTINRRNF